MGFLGCCNREANPGVAIGKWIATKIPRIISSTQGRILIGVSGHVYIILSDSKREELQISRSRTSGYTTHKVVWRGQGFVGKPPADTTLADGSVFCWCSRSKTTWTTLTCGEMLCWIFSCFGSGEPKKVDNCRLVIGR